MAFGKAQEQKNVEIKRYIGIAPVQVIAVNPSKEEIEKIYGREIEKEPVYLGATEINGTNYTQNRIDLYIKTIEDKYNTITDVVSKVTIFLTNKLRTNTDGTKCQVVDSYGNFGWATQEQIQNHTQLVSNSGKKLKIATDYRPAYIGEEELTTFFKMLYNLEAFKYNGAEWVLKDEAAQMTARLDNISKIINGDIKELKDLVTGGTAQKIRVLFGVRTTAEGNMYQDVYSNMFVSATSNKTDEIAAEIERRKNNGGLANTTYDCSFNFREYTVAPSSFNPSTAEAPSSTENPWVF